MTLLIIPHSGTYYGHFEFAVVKSGRQDSKLNVTVHEERYKRPVYTTKETWPSGNKLALPPGEYSVRVELYLPRLDNSRLVLDAVERHYCVMRRHELESGLGGELRREEMGPSLTDTQELPEVFESHVPSSAVSKLGASLQSFSPSHHSTPHLHSFPGDIERINGNDVNMNGSVGAQILREEQIQDYTTRTSSNARDPTPTQALMVFSEQSPSRETSLKSSLKPTPKKEYEALSMESKNAENSNFPLNDTYEKPVPGSLTPWIWKLSPTPEKEGQNKKSSYEEGNEFPKNGQTPTESLHNYSTKNSRAATPAQVLNDFSAHPSHKQTATESLHNYSTKNSRAATPAQVLNDFSAHPSHKQTPTESLHNYSTKNSRAATPAQVLNYFSAHPSHKQTATESLHNYSALNSRECTPNPPPYGISIPSLNANVGIRPRNGIYSQNEVPLNYNLEYVPRDPTPGGLWDSVTPNSSRKPTPVITRPDDTNGETPDASSNLLEQEYEEKNKNSINSVNYALTTPSVSSTAEKVASPLIIPNDDSNNDFRTSNRSSMKLKNSNPSSGKSEPTFLVSPPDEIYSDIPFSFALSFGVPNAKPASNLVFLNILIEEEVEPGITPPEPIISVIPATLAAVPIGAKGINSSWVSSASMHVDERYGVMKFIGGSTWEARNALAISKVCVGPSYDGLALSGVQFVIDNFESTASCQFFVSFREIENLDDDDEEKEKEKEENNWDSNIIGEENGYSLSVDERALGAEVLYNLLPYIRCFKDQGDEMFLEVHRKNNVVFRESIQKGSRISMYFGTLTTKNDGEQQPYFSVLLDYRTVFCSPIRSKNIPEALRVIMMSSVELMEEPNSVLLLQLREVEMLSQQRRLVAFAEEVNLKESKSKSNQFNNNKQSGYGKPGSISAWISGENPGLRARRRVTLY